MSQVVQIPVAEWKRVVRILSRLEADQKTAARAEWITAGELAKRATLTKEQVRGIRERYPELVKPKPDADKSARYLYNWTAYCAIYHN